LLYPQISENSSLLTCLQYIWVLAPTLSTSSDHSTWNRNKSPPKKGEKKKKKKSEHKS
jgi:hypothetical protein